MVREYRSSGRVNYSTLKGLYNPKWILVKKESDEEHFVVGSVLDCLLTSPEDFSKEFVYFKGKKPTGKMLMFVNNLPLSLQFREQDVFFYQNAYELSTYVAKPEKVWSNFLANSDAVEYYLHKVNSQGKTIIDREEFLIVEKLRDSYLGNPFTKKYFEPHARGKDIFYQIPIYFEHLGVKCKGLLDGVYFDHDKKTITIFDLKTTGKPVSRFPSQVLQFSYYLQAAMYSISLEYLLKESTSAWSTHKQFSECLEQCRSYTINNFEFVVASKVGSSPAEIFPMSDNDLARSKSGGMIYDRYRRGVDELLDDYKWHVSTGKWEFSREYIQTKGQTILNLFEDEE